MDSSRFPPRGSSFSSPPKPAATTRPIIPANLNISSFLSFGKQPAKTSSPVKRKPLPPNSPALATKRNGAAANDQKLSPSSLVAGSEASSPLLVRDLDQYPRGQSPFLPSGPIGRKPVNAGKDNQSPANASGLRGRPLRHSRIPSEPIIQKQSIDEQEDGMSRSRTIALQPNSRPPPLKVNLHDRSVSISLVEPKQPRTPGNKITQIFNWKRTASPGDDSDSTDVSDNSLSPFPSPMAVSPQTSRYSTRSIPSVIDTQKANIGVFQDGELESPLVHSSAGEHDLSTKVGQLEGELREITCELAGSIKREMELEDLVEKLQTGAPGSNDETRTSDYYSDSSASSLRFTAVENVLKIEDFEKIKRQSEQEKAQMKVDLSQRWQDEIVRRKALESHVQLLEGQVSRMNREHTGASSTLSSKTKELEASLEDARRRFAEERRIKEKFEDSLTALRNDLEQHRQERDKLRDEVVPELQAKLLSMNIGPPSPSFDHARMQQEIQALKSENAALKEARKAQHESQHGQPRFDTISEEGSLSSSIARNPVGLSRSNSLARAPSRVNGPVRTSLSRSNSIGGKSPTEPREILVDRMKDVEFQRDALHSAMKALLARQECQNKEFQKHIRALEQERDRAMLPPTPRKQGYEKEVRSLRQEINNLRQRANEAMTQKLQCEKGLGGLKMDLDRSEQETSTLRRLLKEHDIALPEDLSGSLQHAYDALQQDRVNAEARIEDDSFSRSLEEEQRLAAQLRQSAERSEGLALQMSAQLATNQALRNRLAQAVGRGERNQAANTGKITELETKLRSLEDTVTTAQQQSETEVMHHEEEIRILKEAHNAQLQRLKASGLRSPTSPGLSNNKRGLTPLVSPMFAQRSPKLDKTTSGPGVGLDQALKTEHLEKKVSELEAALEHADNEMQQVVSRMNTAQIEVMELQTERDEALRQTRKLQAAIMAEREKVQKFADRYYLVMQ
ncbi:hypothetical protein GJ744_000722 [Endocarpon pusillum]|uniref:DUF7603 domain-containing protein n=1 Tax=Endocarpon pusillum TaxID=364733 RepID=A0A8H7AHX8_9EURO|nr:hypothetical protein GJ744_000722 [Endocarpon pusillum]